MNAIIEQLSAMGIWFTQFSIGMLIQSSLLIVILLIVDRLIRKRVRAVVRYCMWMIVLVKLVLPVTLASPTGIGYWAGGSLLDDAVITASAPIESTTGGADSSTTAEKNPGEQGGSPGGTGASESTAGTPLDASQVSAVDPKATSPQRPATVSPGSYQRPGQPIVSRHKDPAITWPAVFLLVWVAVVIAMFLLLVQRWLFVRSLVAQAVDAGEELAAVLDDCRRRLGIRPSACIGLKLSAGATSPAVCGLLRPVILIPSDMPAKLDSRSLRAVLLHELAHVKRLDLQVNFAQAVLQIAYFYNPLLWVANAIIRRIREQAVDETVLVAMGEDADAYPDALVNVAKLALARPALSLRLIGVVESKRALAGRVKHILTRPLPRSARLGAVGAICVIITAAVLLPMARADEPASPAPKTPAAQKTTDKATSRPATPLGAVKAKFRWGIEVELLAVTEHYRWKYNPKQKDKKWWRPDGTPMASGLEYDHYGGVGNIDDTTKTREYVFRISGLDKWDIGLDYSGTEDRGSLTNFGYSSKSQSALRVVIAKVNTDLRQTNIRFGVASRKWDRNADIELDGSMGGMRGMAFFSKPFDDKEGLHVSASDSLVERQCRIIAIDKAGIIHIGKRTGSGGASDKMRLTSVCFKGLKLEKTKEIVFQTRPYRWATFKNVSLEPGHKTKTAVELSPAPLGTQPPPERLTSAPPARDMKKAVAILQRAKPKGWEKNFEIAMATGKPEPYGKNSNISINGMTEPVIEARGKMGATTKPDAEQKIEPMSETLWKFKGKAAEKMIVLWPAKSSPAAAQPDGVLELRVVPNAVGSSRMPIIPSFVGRTKDSFQIAAMKDLATKGPCAVNYGDSNLKLRWIETKIDIPRAGLVVPLIGEYKGKKYVLLCDGDRYAMRPGQGKDAWGLKSVRKSTDSFNKPSVLVMFDEAGSKLFEKLTKANVRNKLAIVVDGKVVSAPVLRTTLRDLIIITGNFTQQQVDGMVKAIKAGMAGQGGNHQDGRTPVGKMKDSGILAKATEELFGEILAAQAKKSGKLPEDAKEPEFVTKFVEELKKVHPNLFRTTPTQKTAFARGEFDDVANIARMKAAMKALEDAPMALPLVDIYIIDQFGAGKLKGARLEVGVRMIELTVSKMQERNHD